MESKQPPEAGNDRKIDFPWRLQKGMHPSDTLILAQWDPCQIYDLQNCQIIIA